MELTAVFCGTTAIEEGVSQNGRAYKRTVALFETIEQYKKNVAITFMNQGVDQLQAFQPGNLVKISLDAESHPYQGKYYTELRGWKIKPAYTIAQNENPLPGTVPNTQVPNQGMNQDSTTSPTTTPNNVAGDSDDGDPGFFPPTNESPV